MEFKASRQFGDRAWVARRRLVHFVHIDNAGMFVAVSTGHEPTTHATFADAVKECTRLESLATECGADKFAGDDGRMTPEKAAQVVKDILGGIFGGDVGVEVETLGTMQCPVLSQHFFAADGRPDGGVSHGFGFTISWQRGPTKLEGEYRRNGAFVTDALEAVYSRIKSYQDGPFKCKENEEALFHIHKALAALSSRREQRKARGVEGTHAV